MARSALPTVVVLALAALAAVHLLAAPTAFVSAPSAAASSSVSAVTERSVQGEAMTLGAAAGLLTAQPAHAGMLFDEIIPYAAAVSISILWGIILGFVLLRLQEAFPE